jgi:peroxidase
MDIDQITSDPGTRAALKEAFSSNVDLIDFWTGGLSENHAPGALIGETFQTVIAMQFEALRDDDRFWFENQGFDAKTLQQIEQTTLADIILRNTDTQHIQDGPAGPYIGRWWPSRLVATATPIRLIQRAR